MKPVKAEPRDAYDLMRDYGWVFAVVAWGSAAYFVAELLR